MSERFSSARSLCFQTIKYWLPSVILMIIIFIGSHDPASGEKSDFISGFFTKVFAYITGYQLNHEQGALTSFVIRKLAHISEYFLLTLSYYYAVSKTFKNTTSFHKTYFIAFLMGLVYAVSDEYHQTFIPGRVGLYEDVLIDSVGILLSYFWYYRVSLTHYRTSHRK
jgi:VanZ family protein